MFSVWEKILLIFIIYRFGGVVKQTTPFHGRFDGLGRFERFVSFVFKKIRWIRVIIPKGYVFLRNWGIKENLSASCKTLSSFPWFLRQKTQKGKKARWFALNTVGVSKNNNYQFKFRMLRRYKKIKEDSRISAVEDRGRYLAISITFVFYLLLSSSISLYLQGIQSLRNFSLWLKNNEKNYRIKLSLIIGNYRFSKPLKEAKEHKHRPASWIKQIERSSYFCIFCDFCVK